MAGRIRGGPLTERGVQMLAETMLTRPVRRCRHPWRLVEGNQCRRCGRILPGTPGTGVSRGKWHHGLDERLAVFVDKSAGPDGCWLWLGPRDPNGYGRLRTRTGHAKAHRVAYEAWIGPIPRGLTIDHLCFNKPCVNPKHLEPVTIGENTRRYWAMRRAS